MDGDAVTEAGLTSLGAGVVVWQGADAVAGLGLTLTVELTPDGLVRTRARLVNDDSDDYQLGDLGAMALPVPPVARELFDFGGRWGRERSPQRGPFHRWCAPA